MGVFIINGMATAGPGNPDRLTLEKYPAGNLCAALNMRFSVPVTSTLNQTGDAADLAGIMLMCIGALTIKDGTGHVSYPTVPGDELRIVHRLLNLNEVPNDIIGTSFTSGQTYQVHFDLRLRMGFPWLSRPESRYPGPSQMRRVEIDIVEGSQVPTGWTRAAGNIIIDVDAETLESDQDQYAPMLSYFRDNQSRLFAIGPDGLTMAAWDANAPMATTALDLFSVSVGAETNELRKPYMVADAFSDGVLQGSNADISDSVTPIYMPTRNADPDRCPTGKLMLRMASQYVSTIQLRGLYWPNVDAARASTATLQATELSKTPILGTVQPSPTVQPSAGISATQPIIFSPPTRPEFTIKPGLLARPGGSSTEVSLPRPVVNNIQAAVTNIASGGANTAVAAQREAVKQIGDIMPGMSSTSGGKSPALATLLGFTSQSS